MSVSVSMPQLGESVTEGTVTRWLKKEGERVEADEPLLEVSTDKVDTEIPSPVSGILRGITVAEDETVAVGAELAVIDETGADGAGRRAAAGRAPAEAARQPRRPRAPAGRRLTRRSSAGYPYPDVAQGQRPPVATSSRPPSASRLRSARRLPSRAHRSRPPGAPRPRPGARQPAPAGAAAPAGRPVAARAAAGAPPPPPAAPRRRQPPQQRRPGRRASRAAQAARASRPPPAASAAARRHQAGRTGPAGASR